MQDLLFGEFSVLTIMRVWNITFKAISYGVSKLKITGLTKCSGLSRVN